MVTRPRARAGRNDEVRAVHDVDRSGPPLDPGLRGRPPRGEEHARAGTPVTRSGIPGGSRVCDASVALPVTAYATSDTSFARGEMVDESCRHVPDARAFADQRCDVDRDAQTLGHGPVGYVFHAVATS